jgi:hypothetical protein
MMGVFLLNQAVDDLLMAPSHFPAPFGVVPGGVLVAQPHPNDAMERSVGLPVTARLQRWLRLLPEMAGNGLASGSSSSGG